MVEEDKGGGKCSPGGDHTSDRGCSPGTGGSSDNQLKQNISDYQDSDTSRNVINSIGGNIDVQNKLSLVESKESDLGNSANGNLYSDRVKIKIARSERLKRNVLEINLESENNADKIDSDAIANLLQTLGILQPDLEGYQISGKKKLFVWLKDGIDLTKYCRDECYRVTTGVKTVLIKPMDNKEVVVRVKGININTPDTLLFSYLSHFGKLVSQKVIYDTDKEGPLKGLKNGDRKYKMDFSNGINMGTFHLIDGASIMISYSGQRKTCGRCHRDARTCIGGGWARSCESQGGTRTELRDHMKQLWEQIGFSPDKFEVDSTNEDTAEIDAKAFTPPVRQPVSETTKANFSGVNIRNLPKDMSLSDLQTLLEDAGLPSGHQDITLLKYKRSMGADVEKISADTSNKLIDNFNEKFITVIDRKLYCSGVMDIGGQIRTPAPTQTSAPIINIDSQALRDPKTPKQTTINIPGLPSEIQNKKTKLKKKIQRTATVVETPGVGNNSRLRLSDRSDESDSDTGSTNSNSTKQKIRMYQNMVENDKAKRGYEEVSPQTQDRNQRLRNERRPSM